jgi:hypothetical protein
MRRKRNGEKDASQNDATVPAHNNRGLPYASLAEAATSPASQKLSEGTAIITLILACIAVGILIAFLMVLMGFAKMPRSSRGDISGQTSQDDLTRPMVPDGDKWTAGDARMDRRSNVCFEPIQDAAAAAADQGLSNQVSSFWKGMFSDGIEKKAAKDEHLSGREGKGQYAKHHPRHNEEQHDEQTHNVLDLPPPSSSHQDNHEPEHAGSYTSSHLKQTKSEKEDGGAKGVQAEAKDDVTKSTSESRRHYLDSRHH